MQSARVVRWVISLALVGCGASPAPAEPTPPPSSGAVSADAVSSDAVSSDAVSSEAAAPPYAPAPGEPPAAGRCARARAIVIPLADTPYGSDERIAAYAESHAAELDAEVAAHPELYGTSMGIRHLRTLLVRVSQSATAGAASAAREQAERYLARLRGGEDFGALIRSEAAQGVVSGHDLGWVADGEVDPALGAAREAQARGLVPVVMRTMYGFVVAEVVGVLPAGATPAQARLAAAIGAEQASRGLAPITTLWSRAAAQARASGVDFSDALRADPAARDATVTDSRRFAAGTETNDLWDMPDAAEDLPTRITSIAVGSALAPIAGVEVRSFAGDSHLRTLVARGFERLADDTCPNVIVRPPLPPTAMDEMMVAPGLLEALRRVSTLGPAYEECYGQFGAAGDPAFGELRIAVLAEGSDEPLHSMLAMNTMHNPALAHCVTERIDAQIGDLRGAMMPIHFSIAFDAP